jgi:hypothetical protein
MDPGSWIDPERAFDADMREYMEQSYEKLVKGPVGDPAFSVQVSEGVDDD